MQQRDDVKFYKFNHQILKIQLAPNMKSIFSKQVSHLASRTKQIIHGNDEYAVLYRSAAYSMGIKVFAVAASFLMNWTFSRYLGANGVGEFFLIFAVINICSMVGKLGMDKTALRYISVYSSQNLWGKVKGVQFFAFKTVAVFTFFMSVLLFLLASHIAVYWFKKPDLINLIRWFALCIVPLAIVQNTGDALKGVKRVQLSQILYDALLPTLAISIFLLWPVKTSLSSVQSYLAATLIVFLITQFAWRHALSSYKIKRQGVSSKEIMQTAMPVFWTSIFQQVNQWLPAFMLGLWASTKDVGLFQVALRTAQLLIIFQYGFYSNLSPKISALYAQGQIGKIKDLCRRTTRLICILALPLLIVFTIFSKFFVGLFGHEFEAAAPLLAIMAAGQYYNIIMGPVGISLIMCNREKKLRNSLAISSCSLLVLNIVLIPAFGALGAAIASCIVLVLQNTLAGFFLWKELGIITLPFVKK